MCVALFACLTATANYIGLSGPYSPVQYSSIPLAQIDCFCASFLPFICKCVIVGELSFHEVMDKDSVKSQLLHIWGGLYTAWMTTA